MTSDPICGMTVDESFALHVEGDVADPIIAGAAMSLSSVSVITNALVKSSH